ncbi:hypothetical protein [Sphingopyxis terrae]|uniref:Secreted protein n=1 Tax=Sphingopyxis terrae subsp. ummariensis TaxID=429001 RepID=A0A1Y6EBJ6_9SPHN|nr:hypothetical protein [Sphingopyxis terrae]PCF93009.1 hypothetical protein CPA46_01720 [Sphingopyxis terrae subsp. ummariensis]SMQ59948.1 hypothetical protein SAMN06295984_0348 [Sphingopyxis terrae subsp. ummariensis]
MTRIILTSLLALSLAACGGSEGSKTTTKLDAVEVEPGTISDSMIVLDDAASDGTAVDTSVPGNDAKKTDSKADDESADSSSDAAPADQSDNLDAVPAPAAKKAQVDSQ